LDPDHRETHFNQSLLWLLLGKWVKGWPEYEWRWQAKGFRCDFQQPRWDGSPLAGRTLLVLTEQGLGDTLQFIRYVPLVQMRGGRVIVCCKNSLMHLLAEGHGREYLAAQGPLLPSFETYAQLLSLPGILGTTLTNIPAEV